MMLNGSFAFASCAMVCLLEIVSRFDTMTVIWFLLGWIAFFLIASAVGINLIGVKFENWIKTSFRASGSKAERKISNGLKENLRTKEKHRAFRGFNFSQLLLFFSQVNCILLTNTEILTVLHSFGTKINTESC